MRPNAFKVASRYLRASIQLPPRYAEKYLQMLWKNIYGISKFFEDLSNEIKNYPDPEDFHSFFRDISDGKFDSGSFWWAKKVGGEHVLPNLKFFLKAHMELDYRNIEYIYKQVKRAAEESKEKLQGLLSINPRLILEGYKWYKVNVPESILFKVMKAPSMARKLQMWLKDAEGKLGELSRTYSRPGSRPQDEKLEILYHTSINAKNLARTGFHAGPAQAAGIGGSTETKTGKPAISFTSDLYVAKEIRRALKEAILVAHGQVKRKDILDWSRREGILGGVLEAYHTLSGGGNPEDPFEVYSLYRAYLTISKRYDPLFFGNQRRLFKAFQSKTPRDVGILVCQVNMRDPNIDYLAAMREYRVPADAVQKILKVLS